MSAAEIRAHYARDLNETISVRRYSGLGAARTSYDATVRGKAWGYTGEQLAGSIQQGDEQVLVLVEDLENEGFELPVTNNDKVVIDGREKSIISPGLRKAPDGTLIAYALQVRG